MNFLERERTILLEEVAFSDSLSRYWKDISERKDSIIRFENEKFDLAEDINAELYRSLKAQKIKSRNTIIGVGVGGTLLGVLIGVLLKQ